jgi:signal transduction histidine kinase
MACAEDKTKLMLEIIDKAVDHSDRIINDLMEYAREIHLDLQEISPRNLLIDSLQMIQVPDTIKICNNLSDEPKFKVDYDKMMRVFINLVKNAIDAMPNKGTLVIRSDISNDNVEIAFKDNGTGIAEEILPKIFSPLFTTKAQGMGFGLAICKRYVEAHQGRITVSSTEGEGATFMVTLPIEPKIELEVNKNGLQA